MRAASRRILAISAVAFALVRFAVVGCSPFGSSEEGAPLDPEDGGPVGSEASTTDGDVDGDGVFPRPCDGSLCTDFDSPETNRPPFGWDRIGVDAGALSEFTLVPNGRSAPYALRLSVDLEAGAPLYLEKNLARPHTVTLMLSVRVEEVATEGSRAARFVELACDDTVILFKINTSRVPFVETRLANLGMSAGRLELGKWRWVELRAEGLFDADGGVVVLRHPEVDASLEAPTPPCNSDVRLRLGNLIVNEGGTGVYTFSFDDVIADWH